MHFIEDVHNAALVSRVQRGDLSALEVLIRSYQGVLYSVAVGMLGNTRKARDVTRSALLRTYGLMSTLDATYGFLSSSHYLLIDECLAVLRRNPVRPHVGPGARANLGGRAEDVPGLASGDAVAFRTLTFDERCDRARAAILRLFPEFRAIVVLRHFAVLSYEETALTLDLPIERVRSGLHAARQQLGELLLGWPRHSGLSGKHEELLQGHIDGALNYRETEARQRLLTGRPDAIARAGALRELGHLLNALAPTAPPADLAPRVLTLIAMLAER